MYFQRHLSYSVKFSVCLSFCIIHIGLKKGNILFVNFQRPSEGIILVVQIQKIVFISVSHPTGAVWAWFFPFLSIVTFLCFSISWNLSITPHQIFYRCSWYYSYDFINKNLFKTSLHPPFQVLWGTHLGVCFSLSWGFLPLLSYQNF